MYICVRMNSLGVKRQIDYVLYSSGFHLVSRVAKDSPCLGSDHRAVKAILDHIGCPHGKRGNEHRSKLNNEEWYPNRSFQETLGQQLQDKNVTRLCDFEAVVKDVAGQCAVQRHVHSQDYSLDSDSLRALRHERKHCQDNKRRRDLSKQIQKEVKKQMQKAKSAKVRSKLEEFKHLNDLHAIHKFPVTKRMGHDSTVEVPQSAADFLTNIFKADEPANATADLSDLKHIPLIHRTELSAAMRRMSRGKCRDKAGIALEMILHGGPGAERCLTDIFNKMLEDGFQDTGWQNTFFTLLPKSGDLSDPGNWRPIAILSVCYKIFAKIIHNRLRSNLQKQHSNEQMGFQPARATEHALFVLEEVVGKGVDKHTPLWFAGLDLKKGIRQDRVGPPV